MLDLDNNGIVTLHEEDQVYETYASQADNIFLENITPPIHRQINYSGYGGCKTIGNGTCTQHHPGIDTLDNKDNGDGVYSIAYGEVVYVGEGDSFGHYVIVEHDVYGTLYYSVYAHLNRVDVGVGDVVSSMSPVGLVGGSGTGGDPSHLHFEVRYASTVDLNNIESGISPLGSTYWANSPEELKNGWLDLSSIFGKDANYNIWND